MLNTARRRGQPSLSSPSNSRQRAIEIGAGLSSARPLSADAGRKHMRRVELRGDDQATSAASPPENM
jgi:hypothetical protein